MSSDKGPPNRWPQQPQTSTSAFSTYSTASNVEGDFEEITTVTGGGGGRGDDPLYSSNFQPYHSTFNNDMSYGQQSTSSTFVFDDPSRRNLWSPSEIKFDENGGADASTGNRTFFTSPTGPRPGLVTGVPVSIVAEKKIVESSKSNILSIVSLLNEHILAHPFLVVRRQAQVNHRSLAFHLTPFTVVPVMARLQARQGVATFFKGLPSSLLNYVFLLGSESILLSFLPFPAEFDFSLASAWNLEELAQHLVFKALAFVIVTPFICSGAVEMVQSLIVGELPSPFESIREGLARVVHAGGDRRLPFYRLVVPSVAYHLARYVLVEVTKEVVYYFYYSESDQLQQQSRARLTTSSAPPPIAINESHFFKTIEEQQTETKLNDETSDEVTESKIRLNKLNCSLFAHLLADVVLYPFETILFRLFLQGTRTLIDNVDGRTAVIPLITSYDNATDCYDTVLRVEGVPGLYKGFGALLLQYGLQYSIIHLTNFCIQTVFA